MRKWRTIADLLVVDLAGEDDLRGKAPELLQELQADGAAIEVGGEWRLQTKESAEWEAAYRSEEKAVLADQSGMTRVRRELLEEEIESSLAVAVSVTHGSSRQQRRIRRLRSRRKSAIRWYPVAAQERVERRSGVGRKGNRSGIDIRPVSSSAHLAPPDARQ